MKAKVRSSNSDFGQSDFIERFEYTLDDLQEAKLCTWIDERVTGIEQDRQQFFERHKKYLYNWDDFITYTRSAPWENASNLHMPLTAIMVNAYVSRLYNLFTTLFY